MTDNIIVKDKDFLHYRHKSFFEHLLYSDILPWSSFNNSALPKDRCTYFGITFAVYQASTDKVEWFLDPSMQDIVVSILEHFLQKTNQQPYKRILRAGVNVTYPMGLDKTPIHYDHETLSNYKQLLIYLDDNKGDTVILDQNEKPLEIVEPEKYKGVCFGPLPHYNYYPPVGSRSVMIITFE